MRQSSGVLPPPEPALLTRIAHYDTKHPLTEARKVSQLPRRLIQSFAAESLWYASDQPLHIQDHIIRGNVLISSRRSVIIESSAQLEDVIVMAPKVFFRQGFRGSVQVFARDSIVVEASCQFLYPSVLCVYSDSSKARISMANHSQVQGLVFVGGRPNDLLGNALHIGQNASIMGQVYVDGLVEHRGAIYGSLACRRFFLVTPSTLYENHLFNSVIDVTQRSTHFITSPLMTTSKRNKQYCPVAPLKTPGKVVASSLVEVTVAMIIMVMIVGMALTIYLKVAGSGVTLQRLRHRIMLQRYANQTKREQSFLDAQVEKSTEEGPRLIIQKKVRSYEGNPRLLLLDLQLVNSDEDSVIAHHKELIYVSHPAR